MFIQAHTLIPSEQQILEGEIIPETGQIRVYTLGWPKNQNMCWYKLGYSPLAMSKYVVSKFQYVVITTTHIGRIVGDCCNKYWSYKEWCLTLG